MRKRTRFAASVVLAAAVAAGVGAATSRITSSASGPSGHVRTQIDVPGDISAVPAAADTTVAPLTLSETQVPIRTALNVAEAEFHRTDSDVDPLARAVPALVSYGIMAKNQNMKVWLVTFNMEIDSEGIIGSTHWAAHKLCVLVDAISGNFKVAYTCGPDTKLPY